MDLTVLGCYTIRYEYESEMLTHLEDKKSVPQWMATRSAICNKNAPLLHKLLLLLWKLVPLVFLYNTGMNKAQQKNGDLGLLQG